MTKSGKSGQKSVIDAIETAITRHPEGIGIAALQLEFKQLSRRTLSRRLAELVESGRLERRGKARAALYHVASPELHRNRRKTTRSESDVSGALPPDDYVPVSEPGRAIRDYVRQAPGERRPVGYRREFLDQYVPNETAYLPQIVREHLGRIGQPPAHGERPAGTYARQILNRLIIDLSWASSKLEGNTYSRLDTERLIQFGQSAEGKDAIETQMILNHKAAIEFLVDQADELRFNSYTLLNLHALLSDNLLSNPDASGRLRQIQVEIAGSVFHPLHLPQVLSECFSQILDTAEAIRDPFEQSFFVMVQLPYLQPFEDVNKRVSRLAANFSLIRDNLCPLSFVDVPEGAYIEGTLGVYELNRVELLLDVFVWAYERSCQRYLAVRQSTAEPDPFRLRYRESLIDAVGRVVRAPTALPDVTLHDYAAQHIPEPDRTAFVDLASMEIARLHEGTIARFRLRPSEYELWKSTMPSD